MPRSFLGGQHKRAARRQRSEEAEMQAREAAQRDESELERELRAFAEDRGVSTEGSKREVLARAVSTLSNQGAEESIADLSYRELQAFAKDHGISAEGSKQGIIARIKAAFAGGQ